MDLKFGSHPAPALAASLGLCIAILAGCGGSDSQSVSSQPASADAERMQALAVATGISGQFSLQSVQTGQCAGLLPGNTGGGAKVQLANCTGDALQLFDITEVSSGLYRFVISGTGKTLDVEHASSSDAAPLQQWDDNTTPAQRFKLNSVSDGVYTLVNLNSNKCLQAADASSVRQYTCNNSASQQFKLGGKSTPTPTNPDPTPTPTNPTPTLTGYVPLFPAGTSLTEQIQTTEPDGTLITYIGMRGVERHARERGEDWNLPDVQPGRYLTFPHHYFQNRTFGLVVRDEVPAGRQKITISMRVNDGTFNGTTFSLFRNVEDLTVRDFGWALNYGFNNPKFLNRDNYPQPICIAGQPDADCQMIVDSNWRTNPEHSKLKIGDPIELAPAPRLDYDTTTGSALIDGGGARYYSFEHLYVVGVGLRPWYGIAPNLDSAPLPDSTLLGGQTSLSYNYSEEPMRVFQQMANNIGIQNSKRFVEGRRLFHTSFADGKHSEHPDENPVFSAHANQLGPRFNEVSCIACHQQNGRSAAPTAGSRFTATILTGTVGSNGKRTPDGTYGLNVLQRTQSGGPDYSVNVKRYDTTVRTLSGGETVELQKPVYEFKGPVPAQFSARQAPQVIGMGLIEALPETTILALADPDDKNGDGVRGIANLVADPETGQTRVGRYGWKAAKASLRHQAAEALVNDMGVVSPVYPSRSCQQGSADCRTKPQGQGLNAQELERLTQYVELLAVPAQRSLRSGFPSDARVSPEHNVDPGKIERGASLFTQANCAACHTATLKTGNTHPLAELRNQTIHPYTNLLLHDMGTGLADNVAEGKAQPNMWRTAPLWGLGSLQYVQNGAQNVRYLHDGRARTLTESILWHGGEADKSRQKFEAFSKDDRSAVIAFLNSL